MYIKFSPNDYVLRYKKGKLLDEGTGLSFFFLERSTAVCAIPVSSTDMDFIFEETTLDYQAVTIQGQLSCRITDFKKISEALDFTVDLKTGTHVNDPMGKLNKRLLSLARVLVMSRIGKLPLTEALLASRPLAEQVLSGLRQSPECEALGITVTGFSVLRIRANPETTRALEAHTREAILKQSDDALYQRRNASIEQERKIRENELSTDISVEEKKRSIRESELTTRRMVLEGNNALKQIETKSAIAQEQMQLEAEIELERKRQELAELRLANAKKEADAEAYRIGAVMEAYNKLSADVLVALATLNMAPEQMIARAFEKLAEGSEKIGTLNITPDLLESLKGSAVR